MGKVGIGLNLEAVRTSHKSFEWGSPIRRGTGLRVHRADGPLGPRAAQRSPLLPQRFHARRPAADPPRGGEARAEALGPLVAQPAFQARDRRRVSQAGRPLRGRMRGPGHQYPRRPQAGLDQRGRGFRADPLLDHGGRQGLRAPRHQARAGDAPDLFARFRTSTTAS